MYWLILVRPYSPSRWSAWSDGTTPVISCMMIEALMYGFTPSATTEKLVRPPPENRSSSPKIGLSSRKLASCVAVDARHRDVGQQPEDEQDPEDVQDPAPEVRRPERVEQGLEHGWLAVVGRGLGGLGGRGLGGRLDAEGRERLARDLDDLGRAAGRLDLLAGALRERVREHEQRGA